VYCINTSNIKKDRNKVDWLFIMKIKLRSHVQIVKDGNDDVTRGEDVF
jgi:hypothetical protein